MFATTGLGCKSSQIRKKIERGAASYVDIFILNFFEPFELIKPKLFNTTAKLGIFFKGCTNALDEHRYWPMIASLTAIGRRDGGYKYIYNMYI